MKNPKYSRALRKATVSMSLLACFAHVTLMCYIDKIGLTTPQPNPGSIPDMARKSIVLAGCLG